MGRLRLTFEQAAVVRRQYHIDRRWLWRRAMERALLRLACAPEYHFTIVYLQQLCFGRI